MVNFTILAGGFSSFVATYTFDSDLNTLSLQQQNPTGDNPSWIALHPQDSSILYAVNEISPVGNLQSFTVDEQGTLTLVDTVSTGGNGPTFTNPLSGGEITGLNFGSPNAAFVGTDPNDRTRLVQNDDSVVALPAPEGASNPHMSLEVGNEVLIADLGADKIWRAAKDYSGVFQVQGQIDVDVGSGPRHMAVMPPPLDNILFTLHEKTSTLTAQQIPQGPNGTALPLIANVSIVPENALQGTVFAAAEILISTPTHAFPDPLIYVSNRNIGETIDPKGDTIAIFQFVTESLTTKMIKRSSKRQVKGSLKLLAQIPTGLQQIRSMAIGRVEDGGDEFLIAGANTEGGVAVFRRVKGGKSLEVVARNVEIANRTSFVFL